MKKKIIGLMLAGTMLFGSMITSYAAETKDETFTTKVTKNEFTSSGINNRQKTNDSRVYIYLFSAPTTTTTVRVMGLQGSHGFVNETIGGTATVYKKTDMSIRNWVYEHGDSLCRLSIKSSKSGTVQGKWSPDSTRTYTLAN